MLSRTAAFTEDGPISTRTSRWSQQGKKPLQDGGGWKKRAWVRKNFLPPRDWLSAASVIGEAHPIIHWEDRTSTAVPENELPLDLAKDLWHQPSGTGESPLANWQTGVTRRWGQGSPGKPTPCHNGQAQLVLLALHRPHNDEIGWRRPAQTMAPVDIYVGGAEPPFFTSSMPVSGTNSSMISVLFQPKNPSKTL